MQIRLSEWRALHLHTTYDKYSEREKKKERHFGTCWGALAFDAEHHTEFALQSPMMVTSPTSHIKYILKLSLLHRFLIALISRCGGSSCADVTWTWANIQSTHTMAMNFEADIFTKSFESLSSHEQQVQGCFRLYIFLRCLKTIHVKMSKLFYGSTPSLPTLTAATSHRPESKRQVRKKLKNLHRPQRIARSRRSLLWENIN